MPIYEYVCEKDGSVIELLRPMSDADKPVEDPLGKGREFKRQHSTFAKGGTVGAAAGAKAGGGACCPCGKTQGGCGAG